MKNANEKKKIFFFFEKIFTKEKLNISLIGILIQRKNKNKKKQTKIKKAKRKKKFTNRGRYGKKHTYFQILYAIGTVNGLHSNNCCTI